MPVIIVLIAIGIFFGYINPTYTGDIASLRAQIKSYDSALVAATAFKAKESELLQKQASVSAAARTRLEAFLPDGVDNVRLILDLDALANRSGIRLSNFAVNDSQTREDTQEKDPNAIVTNTKRPFDSLEVSVTGIGTYQAFRSFLDGAEWSLRPMDLVKLSVQDSDTGVYTYSMTFRIYWLR